MSTEAATGAWQPAPGTASGQFLILERKGDPCSSHAALVRLPQALLIVDCGSAPEQAELISQMAADALGTARVPVLIFLTHAHWDHLAALPLLAFPAGLPVRLLAHGSVTASLAHDARQVSQAFMFNADCPPVRVDMPLLSAADGVALARRADPAPGLALEVVPDLVTLPEGQRVPCDSVRVAGDEVARVFHTPGHSPDSICVQVGGLLWVGDLLLATNPAVAGIRGWNCQALLASLQTVDRLLNGLPLSLCCPGHGRSMPVAKARQVLADVQAQAATLHDVATLDPHRVSLLVEYAEDLLREGLALFTIIAGRLYTVSYHLDALEESQTAREVLQAVDIEGLDAALEELGSYAEQFRQHHRLETALPIKGLQTVGRIEKLFDTERLRGLIDPILLRRARHLLDDFVRHVRGIEPSATQRPEDGGAILSGLAATFMRRAEPARELCDASGDEQAFRQALARSLASGAAGVRLSIDLEIAPRLPPVEVDRARLEDTLHAVLSEFAGASVERVRIAARATPGGCRVEVRPVPDRQCPGFTPRSLRFLDRGLRPGGASLADASTATATALAIDLVLSPPGG